MLKAYFKLTKPGIICGNAITAAGGFALASKKQIDFSLFFFLLAGISLVIASACIFNNYIDRHHDKKMLRTQFRALAQEIIPTQNAIVFAIFIGLLGTYVLAAFINVLTAFMALIGFFWYVAIYSFLKHYSLHATLVGTVAGAMPPVVGYAAASNHLDFGALVIFSMITLWQMPHFFAIAIYRLEDYSAASIPIFPIKKGIPATKVRILFYLIAFIAVSCMLPLLHYTTYTYLSIVGVPGLIWLFYAIKGFKCPNERHWARQMFLFSLIIVVIECIAIPFTII